MSPSARWPRFVLAGLVLLVLVSGLLWWRHLLSPAVFQLQVINLSERAVDRVTVSGTGVARPALLADLAPGASKQLDAVLARQGGLRVTIEQGLNRIDHQLISEVSGQRELRQRLTIHPEQHFIFSSADDN